MNAAAIRPEMPVQIEELRGRIKGVERDQKNHEDICAERYDGIRHDIKTLNKRISWAAITVVGVILSVLGWSLNAQYDQAQQTQKALIAIAQGAKPGAPGATVEQLPYQQIQH